MFKLQKWSVIKAEWGKLSPPAKIMMVIAIVVPCGLMIAGAYAVVRKLMR